MILLIFRSHSLSCILTVSSHSLPTLQDKYFSSIYETREIYVESHVLVGQRDKVLGSPVGHQSLCWLFRGRMETLGFLLNPFPLEPCIRKYLMVSLLSSLAASNPLLLQVCSQEGNGRLWASEFSLAGTILTRVGYVSTNGFETTPYHGLFLHIPKWLIQLIL